jgi:hypothetical protein
MINETDADIANITIQILRKYIEDEEFKGYDPYDLLNSRIKFSKLGHKFCFYATQIHKRNPINIRKLVLIKKTTNPKTLGILLSAYSFLYKVENKEEYLIKMKEIYKVIISVSTKGFSGFCWGLDYDYANSIEILPAYSPSIVVTSIVCSGIFEYYLITKDEDALSTLISASEFALKDLDRTYENETVCFSYTTTKTDVTYNANGFCADLLSKVYYLTNEEEYLILAKSATDFNINHQHADGRWNYSKSKDGIEKEQVDFHQGYILDSLNNFIQYSGIKSKKYDGALQKGLDFYFQNQFNEDGKSLWRIPKEWPVDIHNQAQGIISFSELSYIDDKYYYFASKVLDWSIKNMLSDDKVFYYRKYKNFNNKISYIRWSQAWMFLAISKYLYYGKKK